MTGLIIVTEIALAGCAFLLYFLYALWRDARKSRQGACLEIRRLSTRVQTKGKLLRLYLVEGQLERKKL